MSDTRPQKFTDDTVLVSLIAAGDQAAFSQFMGKYLRPIAIFSTRYLASRDDGEDVAQAVFIDVWRKAEQFDESKASAKTWLYRIARNRCIDLLRRRRLRQFVGLDDATDDLAEDVPSVAQTLTGKQDLRTVIQAIDKLPDRQRMALVLFAISDMQAKAISEVMETSEGAVEQLIARARKTLKQKISRI